MKGKNICYNYEIQPGLSELLARLLASVSVFHLMWIYVNSVTLIAPSIIGTQMIMDPNPFNYGTSPMCKQGSLCVVCSYGKKYRFVKHPERRLIRFHVILTVTLKEELPNVICKTSF